LQILDESTFLRDTLIQNTQFFRVAMTDAGFHIVLGTHPIVAAMLGDATLATKVADEMLKQEVYVVGFSYPVVPIGLARIRTQISAPDSLEELDRAVRTSINVRNEFEFQ
ncbi:MAG: aminotransferase class I/II-fold pyridoxal phosphate-dependent enzyme, partial [Akkermansiaceae bacterium]|nr:aminotransferase class I/II-fold pyridoxal phosphate-dependent enzyme [Akkermansiaceae bacterium]